MTRKTSVVHRFLAPAFFLAGVGSGWLLRGDGDKIEQRIVVTKPLGSNQQDGRAIEAKSPDKREGIGETQVDVGRVSFSGQWSVLPAAATKGLYDSRLEPGRLQLKADRVSFLGISPEQVDILNAILADLEAAVKAHEHQSAVRRSSADGEFYSIPASEKVFQQREETLGKIRALYRDNPAMGEAVLSVVFNGTSFSNYGKSDMEVSIADRDIAGSASTVIEMIYRDPVTGERLGGQQATWSAKTIKTRFPFFGER